MAIIKKFPENLPTPLTNYNTFLVDTNPNSTYFKITEFKDTFTGGKNGFLIEGSEHLKETTEIKIQILDVAGNPIYYEPGNGVPEYYEGTSKLVAVYVYEDTPIGEAKITILGEAKTYIDDNGFTQQIPDEWKGIYNLKWEKTFKVNKLLSNEDKVRFYRRPEVTINEIVKPIFNNIVTPIVQKGIAIGTAQSPAAGTPLANYTLPTSYLITTTDNSAWTGSVVGTYLEFKDLGVNLLVDDIVDKNNLTVSTPYTINGLVRDFTNTGYTASFNYTEGVDNLKTALTGSFAKINITDLTTFVGDVARVKIFRRSQSDLSDYQFVQEIQLESNEVLVDLESQTKNQEFYGIFDQNNFKNYWVTSSNNLTTTFNQNYLFNSVKLDGGTLPTYYHTTKSFSLSEGAEYTLGLNYRGDSTTTAGGALSQLRVFVSGSRSSTFNGVTSLVGVEQNIATFKGNSSAILQKQNQTINFQSENFIEPKLYFEVKGTGWHISDVSLRASQETSFSPDEITFIQPIPRTLPAETFDFIFQFYDINNNYIPVVVTETKTFDGGNLNRINKSIELVPSSLYFQFDSGSGNGNPVPPTTIFIDIVKNFLTGSYTFTSRSFDFFNNELSSSMYSQLITPGYGGGQFPGYLNDNNGSNDTVFLTVQNFTGSRDPSLEEIVVQFIEYTVECEGVEDSIVITRVIDGKGGVNYEIRPYNGIVIRNSHPSSSLEVQAIRIDGVNEVKLQRGLPAGKSNTLLYVQSGSTYITLLEASQSQFVRGIRPGVTGSGQVEYNAIFNRDSINGQLTLYMIPTGSLSPSSSILTSLTLTDLQDGLDAGVVLYDADSFTINPRTENKFTPTYSSVTASFYRRGTFEAPISCSLEVYPSMSLNKDWVPEYWMQFTTWSANSDITIAAYDESGSIIQSRLDASNFIYGSPLSQSKQLLISFTYTEPYSSASVNVDKLFQIVPEGKPGDESIIFEIVPSSVALSSNSRGVVTDYKPSTTEIKLKQGSRYLVFTGSVATDQFNSHGQFHVATSSIRGFNIIPGNVQFTSSNGQLWKESLIISASSNLTDLTGSIEIPIQIHPYFTSSIYTQSVFLNFTKVLEGPPPIQIIISPTATSIKADEVGFVTNADYAAANTTITVKEGDDFLRFTTQSTQPGSWRINKVETSGSLNVWNIRTGSLASSSINTATLNFNRFDHPYVSASATYTIQVYPFALGAGHSYTSSIFTRTQTFTKNISTANARTVNLKATYDTVNFDKDGVVTAPLDPIVLTATTTNTTGAVFFQFFKDDIDYSGIVPEDAPNSKFATLEVGGGDITGPGENATWTVKIRDGNGATTAPIRAENSLTIAGIKGGADSYKLLSTNDNCTITADLFSTSFAGTGMKITTFKGVQQLQNVPYYNPNNNVYDYLNNFIGILGFSSASIFSKSNYITMAGNKFPVSNPAEIGNITGWTSPAINKSGQIVYKVEFEGESSGSFISRQTQFVTQSISVQFEPPAPYDVKMSNDNSAIVYKVAGSFIFTGTGNIIRAYRGSTELVNTSTMPATDTDAYGVTGLSQNKCRVSIYSKSAYITLAGGLTAGSFVSGTPATLPNIVGWGDPELYPNGEIVYQIDCEGRQTLYKTQSLAIQYEGNVGPGLVMRGEWDPTIDYYGSVENINDRLDVVTYLATVDETHYYAAISGSGPTTYVNPTTSTFYRGASPPPGFSLIGPNAPTALSDNAYWRYLGQEDFFVAAKLAIFERSFVKNSINVGTKDTNGAFANIVINGGRPDPYIAMGQTGTLGTAGTSGTSAPLPGVIGYDRPGIFLGIYENGTAGTSGRFSIKDTSGNRFIRWDGSDLGMSGKLNAGGMELGTGVNGSAGNGLFLNANNYWYDTGTNFKVGGPNNYLEWNGSTLTLRGSLRQIAGGDPEGTHRGNWAASTAYYVNDVVFYIDSSYICITAHTSTNNTNINTGYPPNATNSWTVYAAAGTSGTAGSGGSSGSGGTSGTAGAQGDPGAGVVYRGPFTIGTQYFRNPAAPASATRRDIVKGNDGAYYLCKLTYTPTDNSTRPPDGGSYSTYWEAFGATFSSVATDILLAQDATITRGLVIGTDGLTNGFIRSTGATSLTTGSAAGFYLQQDGQFRFGNNPEDIHYGSVTPPYIRWDNTNLTIKGKIITDNTQISEIGNWQVNEGKFQDSTTSIVLNAGTKTISVLDSGTQRVIIKNTDVSNPASTGTVVINPPQSTNYSNYGFGPGILYNEDYAYDTTGFSVAAIGSYSIATLDWGAVENLILSGDNSFTGDVECSVVVEIWDSPDLTGNQIDSFLIAQSTTINSPLDEVYVYFFDGYSKTLYFGAIDTYYLHVKTQIYGSITTGNAYLDGNVNAQSQTFNAAVNQTELGKNGMLVVADAFNYVKIERYDPNSTINPIIDIKTNIANNPALRITNAAGGTARAIEVLDGDIYLQGAGNNMRVNGGYVGTDDSTNGVRMGTVGSNSVLMGGNWPSQVTNVATARLRPGATKFGINGRELIFDSSTIRIKKDIEDYPENAYESIKNLRPVLYNPLKIINSTTYETDGEEDYNVVYPMPNAKEYIGKQGGFVAEWLDSDPEMRRYVSYGVSGSVVTVDSLAYDKIVVPLTKAVQILMDKVESIEAFISSSK